MTREQRLRAAMPTDCADGFDIEEHLQLILQLLATKAPK